FLAESDKVPEKDIPTSHQAGYIGVVIGAALATKQLPTDQLRELCQRIRFPIILLGGVQDRQRGEEIRSVEPEKIYNACGKFRLNESADLVRRARLIVTPDTGLMHIAAAFQKPVLSIWGNTIPEFGMYPYYGTAALDHSLADYSAVKKLWCRPCSKIGYARCPLGHFRCMRLQPVQELAHKVHQRLGIRNAPVGGE
ncbi:MAG: glycosyltransferase family 9 protein, partial [Chitinophagaceae bacterium]